jgi:hypothetical protein
MVGKFNHATPVSSKYKNTRCEANGIKFDSKAERLRYMELARLERLGVIRALELQPRFTLLDKFESNGTKYRAITYVADFRYLTDNKDVVEDVKGVETKEYLLKRKLFLSQRDLDVFGCSIIFKELRLKRNKWEVTEL